MIVRANLLSSLQKLLDFLACQSGTLGISGFCGASKSTQAGCRVRFDKPFFDGVVEESADNA
jgi:hypothetical protein